MTQTKEHEFLEKAPYVEALVAKHGGSKASSMLGLSAGTLGNALNKKKIRPSYEIAAKTMLQEENVVIEQKKSYSYVVKFTPEQNDLFLLMFKQMNVSYMDLDL